MTFLVTRYADQIAPGDRVFLWRSSGSDPKDESGIIAEAAALSSPFKQPDDPASRPYWLDGSGGTELATRVQLRINRSAQKKEIIQRKWLLEDPILRELTILKMANATNYDVPLQHAARLNALWLKTGSDWTYADSVAGLWAYQNTYGGEVSRLPGSVIAATALMIGRAVPGCYNKVMNFRHIDPRDPRQGLSGAAAMDRQVWTAFYDVASKRLRERELEAEYRRFWPPGESTATLDTAQAARAAFEADAKKLSSLSLTELTARYTKASRGRSAKPSLRPETTRTFDRDPLVVAIALVRAGFRCEVRGCSHPPFEGQDGLPYCEIHHIHPLADGGADIPGNVACLCPAHHREVHHGKVGSMLNASLLRLRGADQTVQPLLTASEAQVGRS